MLADFTNAPTEQRADALTALGLSLKSVCTDAGEAHIPRKRKGRESKWLVTIQGPKGQMTSPYIMGAGLRNYGGRPIPQVWEKCNPYQERALSISKPNRPDIVSVVYSLVSDAQLGNDTFDGFCGNLGYDTDSRKALESYLACQKIGSDLSGLGVSFDAIAHIVEGY